jgi:predicted RNA-binding protein
MCLSTIYSANDVDKTEPLAKNITSVTVGEGSVVISDLLGDSRVIDGFIERVDLIKNYIIIRPLSEPELAVGA